MCLEYVKHNYSAHEAKKNSNDRKPIESLLWGDDLGIITMYKFYDTNWHICQYKAYCKEDRKYLTCHMEQHKNNFNDAQWKHEALKDTLALSEQLASYTAEEAGRGAAAASGSTTLTVTANKNKDGAGKKRSKEQGMTEKKHKTKPKPTQYKVREEGFSSIKLHTHWGWVTKIKFYDDLNMLLSSSLDGFIHMHNLDDLAYKAKRTFNLHQKGINSFVYSVKHKQVASCGEERHIILWEPYTLQQLAYLNGHNTSVSHLDINEERNHLISLGTDKVVKIWDTRHYECIQTIIDRQTYRPEDILSALTYDPITHNILVCSIAIKFWPFKT